MLWRKKKSADVPAPDSTLIETNPGAAPDPSQKALDAVTVLVRLYGKHAFDTDMADASSIEARCDEWATRISLGAPRPHDEDDDGPDGAKAQRALASAGFRDWAGLIAFIRDQRRAESEYVVRSMGGFRNAILTFAGCLGKTIAAEQKSDARLEERIGTLKRAIDKKDPTHIVNEAERVVDAVREAMQARRQREVEEIRMLGEHVRELREELSVARKQAEIDALTQLSNRAAFDAQLLHLASLGVLLGQSPWLMIVDLDHFKSINDNYGHPTGDEVLRQVSHCLSRTFLRKQDFVSRYGGEEFAIILLDTTREQMTALAERLLQSVRELNVKHGEREVKVTLSAGLAALRPGEAVSSWLARADAAMYRAKHEGRDDYRVEP
ncbi:MAG TPA: GGDEF domain-containing protein [Polyangiaceae bacterium]|nr:GGDEF domain-containing protein [Polyangiaceae bacterium]